VDSIIEAICELRFESPVIPEVLYGRLIDDKAWADFEQRRLPAYDIPAPMRQADDTLRYAPVLELLNTKSNCSFRIGPQVASFHQRPPYGGWQSFRPMLTNVVEQLFSKSGGLTIKRLGFRYSNALNMLSHGIAGVGDLDCLMEVAGRQIKKDVNLNFNDIVDTTTRSTVRVATPEFVQGQLPDGTTTFIDVDIYTVEGFTTKDQSTVMNWVDRAHNAEKICFFDLLTQSTIDSLKES
jgi:uncharacterized protein (TIGR04255 family)